MHPTTRALLVALLVGTTSAQAGAETEKDRCATAAESAQRHRQASALSAARGEALVCARDVCPPVIRNDCARWAMEIEAAVPSITLRARDPDGHDVVDAVMKVDGEVVRTRLDGTPVTVDPGERVVRVEARGYASVEQRILALAGEKSRPIVVDLVREPQQEPAARPSPSLSPADEPARAAAPTGGDARRTWGFVTGGAGIVALGAFAGLQIKAQGDYADLRDGCGQTGSCAASEVSDVRGYFVGSGVSLVAAAVLFGASAWLLFGPGSVTDTR